MVKVIVGHYLNLIPQSDQCGRHIPCQGWVQVIAFFPTTLASSLLVHAGISPCDLALEWCSLFYARKYRLTRRTYIGTHLQRSISLLFQKTWLRWPEKSLLVASALVTLLEYYRYRPSLASLVSQIWYLCNTNPHCIAAFQIFQYTQSFHVCAALCTVDHVIICVDDIYGVQPARRERNKAEWFEGYLWLFRTSSH